MNCCVACRQTTSISSSCTASTRTTPPEEVLSTLDQLVRVGKIRYVGFSNFSGWHAMKSLSVADRYGYPRYVANQTYYSLIGRDYEWELMPLGLDQRNWRNRMESARLGPAYRQNTARAAVAGDEPVAQDRRQGPAGRRRIPVYASSMLSTASRKKPAKSIPQIALNWLFHRPTVSSVIIGARNEQQLKDNLGAIGWSLTEEQIKRLDAASATPKPYPYWHQSGFAERNPPPV